MIGSTGCRFNLWLQVKDQGIVLANNVVGPHGKGNGSCSYFHVKALECIKIQRILPAREPIQEICQTGILAAALFLEAGGNVELA